MTSQHNRKKCSESAMVVEELISVGLIHTNLWNNRGLMPLHVAVTNNKSLLTQSLLQNGDFVNARNKEGETPLAMAIHRLLPEMVDILFQYDVDLNKVNKFGESALWLVVDGYSMKSQAPAQLKMTDLILQHALKSKNSSQLNYYKLCKAIIGDDSRAIRRLINLSKDVNFRDIEAESPLKFAIWLGQLKTVELLLEKGADPNREDPNHQSVLLLAMSKSLEMVKVLVKFKTDINKVVYSGKNSSKKTPLYWATENGDIELLKFLLESGARVNSLNDCYTGVCDDTPLHSACREGYFDELKLLLNYGAMVNAKNSLGETPLLVNCETDEDVDCIKLLVSYGADVTATNNQRQTILHYVGCNYMLSVVNFVMGLALNRGVDINARDRVGKTAMDDTCCENVVEFLKNGANLDNRCRNGSYQDHDCSEDTFDDRCFAFHYVTRLKYLGYKIKNPYFQVEHISNDLLELYRKELHRLKNEVFAWNPGRSLYDVLFMSRDSLVRYSVNDNLIAMFVKSANDLELEYPYFGSILNLQLRRGFNRKHLNFSSKINLQKSFGIAVPDICSQMIFKYLENHKLKKFAVAKFE